MAVLDVVKAGHPVLKQIAEPVEHVNKKLRALIDDMAETMYETDGVGLAAPQVAVSKRIIVVDDHAGSGLIALINPEITHAERFDKITVKGIDPHNKKVTIKAEGFLARIFQHEIDHLEGHLFIEKATNLRLITDHPEEKEIV